MKKVSFGSRPQPPTQRISADDWVKNRNATESMKRLTVDVTLSLHRRIKTQCALRGDNMADVVRDLLEKHFPEEYQERGAKPKPASS